MSETKVFLYVVDDARLLLQKARRENESAVCLNSRAVAKYRIMKATTTFEVLDE